MFGSSTGFSRTNFESFFVIQKIARYHYNCCFFYYWILTCLTNENRSNIEGRPTIYNNNWRWSTKCYLKKDILVDYERGEIFEITIWPTVSFKSNVLLLQQGPIFASFMTYHWFKKFKQSIPEIWKDSDNHDAGNPWWQIIFIVNMFNEIKR